MRKSLFDYDQVLNTQRDKVYAIRRQALLSDDLSGLMLDFSARTMDDILEVWRPSGHPWCTAAGKQSKPHLVVSDRQGLLHL